MGQPNKLPVVKIEVYLDEQEGIVEPWAAKIYIEGIGRPEICRVANSLGKTLEQACATVAEDFPKVVDHEKFKVTEAGKKAVWDKADQPAPKKK